MNVIMKINQEWNIGIICKLHALHWFLISAPGFVYQRGSHKVIYQDLHYRN